MAILINFLLAFWFWLALIMSLFWGIRSAVLFKNQMMYERSLLEKFFWKSYEFIFNFVGSFAGWFCFYALLVRTQNNIPHFKDFGGGDIILFIVSLLGLTGHLPQTIYGFVQSFAEIINRIIGNRKSG